MNQIKIMDLRKHKGRVFFSTDIHGHFDLLHEQMTLHAFDTSKDLLIVGGDNCDRGPTSHRILGYINEPWFVSIRANHEEMVISAVENPTCRSEYEMLYFNGGSWFFDQPDALQNAIYESFKALPLAIELILPNEVIGIIHAQCPYNDWNEFKKMTGAELDYSGAATAQWARTNYCNQWGGVVEGVDRLLVGHSPTNSGEIEVFGNTWYCDLGSFFRNKISFIQLL